MEPVWGPIEDPQTPGLTVQAFYLKDDHEFRVVAQYYDKKRSALIQATFEPTFGLDVADRLAIETTAEQLADTLIAEPQLK